VIVLQIFYLNIKGITSPTAPIRLSVVEHMSSQLLATRDASRIGKHWASTLSCAVQSSGHASSVNTTTRELSGKIRRSFVAVMSSYGTQLRSMELMIQISKVTTLTRPGL
jgi:hypothetical protein